MVVLGVAAVVVSSLMVFFLSEEDSAAGAPSGSQNGGRVLVNSAPGRCFRKTWCGGGMEQCIFRRE